MLNGDRLSFVLFVRSSFENTGGGASVSSSGTLDSVIPAWSAGIQIDMDVSGGILAIIDGCRQSMPA
jgi:hypothetical protein